MPVNFSVTNQLASPAIYASSFATRPAASFNGRLFVDTDNPSTGIYRDTGTAWIAIAGTGVAETQSLESVCQIGNSSSTGILVISQSAFGTLSGSPISPVGDYTVTIGESSIEAPSNSLFVKYTALFEQNIIVQTNTTTPLLIGGDTTTSTLTYRTTTAAGITGARHIFQVGNNGATEAMTILNNANVGIGTASPNEKLTVNGNINLTNNAERYIYLDADNTGTGRLIIQAGGGSSAYGGAINLFSNAHATKPGWVSVGLSQNSASKFTINNSGLASGTDIFTVLYNGNTLLNSTTDAGYKLDVNGTGRFSGSVAINGTTLDINPASGQPNIALRTGNTYRGYIEGNASGGMDFGTGASAAIRLTIASTGAATFSSSVSIGGADQDYQLDVKRTSTGDATFDTVANFYKASTHNTGLLLRLKNTIVDLAANNITGGVGPSAGMSFSVSSGGTISTALTLASTGAATFSSSVSVGNFTTAQKNALTAVSGMIVYDTTLNKLCVYTTAWETITSI